MAQHVHRKPVRFKRLLMEMSGQELKQKDLAEVLGISAGCVSNRIKGKNPFTLEEVYKICDFMNIEYSKMSEYFPPPIS